jgi:hypothetical protein
MLAFVVSLLAFAQMDHARIGPSFAALVMGAPFCLLFGLAVIVDGFFTKQLRKEGDTGRATQSDLDTPTTALIEAAENHQPYFSPAYMIDIDDDESTAMAAEVDDVSVGIDVVRAAQVIPQREGDDAVRGGSAAVIIASNDTKVWQRINSFVFKNACVDASTRSDKQRRRSVKCSSTFDRRRQWWVHVNTRFSSKDVTIGAAMRQRLLPRTRQRTPLKLQM